MVLLTLTSRFNKIAGPFLLRCGLRGRYILSGGSGIIPDNPTLDAILLLPLSQKIVSIEVHDDAVKEMKRSLKEPSTFEKFTETSFDRIFGKDSETRDSNEPKRLKALEEYLRPVLLPNERWSDVIRWRFNNRFLKWVRAEFLIAKHGLSLTDALKNNPNLRLDRLLSSKKTVLNFFQRGPDGYHDERMTLPSSKHVRKAFGMDMWKTIKDTTAEWERMTEIAERLGGQVIEVPGSSLCLSDIAPETDLSGLSLEDLLEVAGCHVASCGPLNALCEDAGIYELWTKEYASALASYLVDQSEAFSGETVVLDVGAGDGLLAHFLQDYIYVEAKRRIREEQAPWYARRRTRKPGSKRLLEPDGSKLPRVVAVDNGSWNIETKAQVENLNVSDAIEKYAGGPNRQLIILCSWMPMGEDWTSLFRAAGASEYILIGECDDGTCGDNWATWGNSQHRPVLEESFDLEGSRIDTEVQDAPYELDGFERRDLEELSSLHFSRFDSSASKNSRTVSFRKTSPV